MTKIFLDKSKIEHSFIPTLTNAISNLNNAVYESRDLDIPSDFEFVSYLKDIGNKNYKLLEELVVKKNNLENIVSKLGEVEKKNYSNFDDISILNIYNRTKF